MFTLGQSVIVNETGGKGTIIYIHPDHHFLTVRFANYVESFSFSEVTGIC